MEPFTTAAMVGVGIGLQLFGADEKQQAAEKYNAEERQQIMLQKQVEAQRKQAMELDARRKQIENTRMMQRMRGVALTNATSQGAAQGSGLQGGYGQISGQGTWNALGIGQNLEIGRNIFGLNDQISDSKIAQSYAKQQMGDAEGFSSLGNSLVSSAGTFGKLTSGFGNSNYGPSYTPSSSSNAIY